MNYEKKYKEALEWARKVMQGKVGFVLDEVLEKFPELKESEDEKIRKAIRTIILSEPDIYKKIGFSQSDCLVWIEKQEEDTYDYKRVDLDKFDDRIQEFSDMLEDKPKPYWDGWYEAMEWIRTHGNPFEKKGVQGSSNSAQECLRGIKRVQKYNDLSDWEKKFDSIASMYAHSKNQEGYDNSQYVKESADAMLYYAKRELEEGAKLQNDLIKLTEK